MTTGSSLFGLIPDIEHAAQELRARIDVYDESIHVAVRSERGIRRMEVAPEDLAHAFQGIALTSGILPKGTVFWASRGTGTRIGVEIPPGRRDVTWRESSGRIRSGRIPYPRLLFIGEERSYRLYALKSTPLERSTVLWEAPFPNIYADGRICRGTAPFPDAHPQTMMKAFDVFMESEFNADLSGRRCHSYPEDVRRLWEGIRGRRRFPEIQLIKTHLTLGDLIGKDHGPDLR
ncbi:MAG: hypothetical protein HYT87_13050 [Nitrospirae bacterium]|nr:hypothetical protein [Nitrospirota bacterium]